MNNNVDEYENRNLDISNIFYGCSKLFGTIPNVLLNPTVEIIGTGAFKGCTPSNFTNWNSLPDDWK